MLPKTLFPYYHRHTDMKLEPKAKPIRIRIKLGNSEYSSWDSVKKSNFSIKELYPLFKDGRLERWLEQIGEKQFAHRTGELSKQCGNGDMKDYIQFLSLFFDEVADSLSAYKGEEWSLYNYLSSARLDTVEIIYAKTMDVEEIDWGEEFAKLVTDVEKYKDLFTYLESFSKNNPQPERCRRIISTFYNNCSKKGYQWASAFEKKLSLDYIADIYQNECFQIPDVDWGKLFADCVKDWATDSERIEKIIKSEHNISFYNHCVKNGFEEAKKRLDPWYEMKEEAQEADQLTDLEKMKDQVFDYHDHIIDDAKNKFKQMEKEVAWFKLANSDDYKFIIKALKEWDGNRGSYNKYYYNYYHLRIPLGNQILDFLQFLIDLRNKHGDLEVGSDYLEDEKQVMLYVRNRELNDRSYFFDNETSKKLDAMRKRGVELADYVLKNSTESYLKIAKYAVEQFAEKLNSKR